MKEKTNLGIYTGAAMENFDMKNDFLYIFPSAVAPVISFLILFLWLFPVSAHAESEKFYNFEVTIDRATDDQFYEKIEVYLERNGKYFAEYDLNRGNQYTYRSVLTPGEYQVSARVRYDQLGTYTIEPEQQEFIMTAIEYKNIHSVIFSVKGNEDQDESHELQEADDSFPVYTVDQMGELQQMQDTYQRQAEKEMEENDAWEREHSFLAQNNIEDRNDDVENQKDHIQSRAYPDTADEGLNEYVEPESSGEEKEDIQETDDDSQISEQKKDRFWFVPALVFIPCLIGMLFLVKPRGENEDGE